MTRDDIIRMAREVGILRHDLEVADFVEVIDLEIFADMVTKAEREACAKVCDGWTNADGDRCAEAIRAMGEK